MLPPKLKFWKSWIESVRGERPYAFQQDSVPSHKAMTTQDWMSENLQDHVTQNIWPPISPDHNPYDFYIWGLTEWGINKHPHNTLDSLRAAFTGVMMNMDVDHLIQACKNFQQRIESVIATKGDFIK